MYVYIRSEHTLWTVGFYDPQGKWRPESDHSTSEEAAARVHWLNGGKDTDDDRLAGSYGEYIHRYFPEKET
jgi:hypothetical protein